MCQCFLQLLILMVSKEAVLSYCIYDPAFSPERRPLQMSNSLGPAEKWGCYAVKTSNWWAQDIFFAFRFSPLEHTLILFCEETWVGTLVSLKISLAIWVERKLRYVPADQLVLVTEAKTSHRIVICIYPTCYKQFGALALLSPK